MKTKPIAYLCVAIALALNMKAKNSVAGGQAWIYDDNWASSIFSALQRLVDHRSALPVILNGAVDTEIASPAEIKISRDVLLDMSVVVPAGSSVMCHYQAVRGGTRIPVECDRIITPKGADYRIQAAVYGLDGGLGIPADGVRSNGALQAGQAKPLKLYLNGIIAVGLVGGPMWPYKVDN